MCVVYFYREIVGLKVSTLNFMQSRDMLLFTALPNVLPTNITTTVTLLTTKQAVRK
jgi:hypothetical protein